MKHRWNVVLALLAIGLGSAVISWDGKRFQAPPETLEAPVPLQEWTTDAGVAFRGVAVALPGKLPPPAENQRKAGQCDRDAAQVEVNGGCWVETTTPRPCPKGKQWEHEGRCWLPVFRAARTPQSSEPRRPGGVAGP